MPPSNLFFQIGCFLTGSRTTIPPSADTRTLTGSVPSPIRTLGPEGACRRGRDGGPARAAPAACGPPGAGVGWGASFGAAARPRTAPAPRTVTRERNAAVRNERVIGDGSLARRPGLT